MRRREFINLLGGAAAWPIAASAQQRERMRRIGILLSAYPADDPEAQTRITAFVQGLQQLGWTDGRNVRIDTRFGLGDADHLRRLAADFVTLAPDVMLAGGGQALMALQQASSTLPITFANVNDQGLDQRELEVCHFHCDWFWCDEVPLWSAKQPPFIRMKSLQYCSQTQAACADDKTKTTEVITKAEVISFFILLS